MSPFDLPTNLAIVGAAFALICGVLVGLYAPLAWLARRSERFAAWVDGVVQRVL